MLPHTRTIVAIAIANARNHRAMETLTYTDDVTGYNNTRYLHRHLEALIRAHEEPCQIHNNCSGKHAGWLAACAVAGLDPEPGQHVREAARARVELGVGHLLVVEHERRRVGRAVHLRFDIARSSLPDFYKQRLLKLSDSRISSEGVIVIKAQRYRDRDKNRVDALERFAAWLRFGSTSAIASAASLPAADRTSSSVSGPSPHR